MKEGDFPVRYSNRDTKFDPVRVRIYSKVDGKWMHDFPYNNSKLSGVTAPNHLFS